MPTASLAPMRAIGNPVALDASADERDTRGFISITSISPFTGLTANWMLQPPASTPISRMIATGRIAHRLVFAIGQRHRRRHGDRVAGVHAHRIEVLDRADDHDVVRVIAHHLELELLPAEQRCARSSTCVHRRAGRGRDARCVSYSSRLYAMPPPDPPSVNDGRMIAGIAGVLDAAHALRPTCARIRPWRTARPIRAIASANCLRSSATRIARAFAPISSHAVLRRARPCRTAPARR